MIAVDQDGPRQDAEVTFGYFDPEARVSCYYEDLPHWRQEGVTYFVTFRLADSLPQSKLRQWQAERERWVVGHPEPHDAKTRREYYERFPHRLQEWLDAGYGECVLARFDVRSIVEGAMAHFNKDRYLLDQWVIMPNHVHVIITPLGEHKLSDIQHSWKSFSAKGINTVLGRSGKLWQKESFDHIIRNAQSHERIREYIRNNPSGLAEGRYSLGVGTVRSA